MKRYFIALSLIVCLISNGYAIPVSSKANGNWSLAATWNPRVPLAGDDVTITHAVNVNVSTNLINSLTLNAPSLFCNVNNVINCSGLITITAGTMNFFSTNLNAGSITIGSSGAISLNGGTIALTGNLTNNGNFNDAATTSSLLFNGGTTQQIGGSNLISIANITVDNNSSLSLTAASHVDLNGGLLTINDATSFFDADGTANNAFFTVKSSSLADLSRIASLPTPANFSGNVTIERFIDGKAGGDYRYLSAPVINCHADVWKSSIGITGNFSDPSTNTDYTNISNAGNTNASAFFWNYSLTTPAYAPVDGGGGTVASTSLDSRKGYVAYNFNDAGDDAVISYTGAIEKSDVPVSISTTSNAFSLIPNPYPSPIDWDKVYNDNLTVVTGAIWFRNANNSFTPYVGQISPPPGDPTSPTGKIAIAQSYWVQSLSGSSGTLTFKEAHKSALASPSFIRKETPINYFWISLSSATQKDYAGIRFHPSATDDQDAAWDAVKRRNGDLVSKDVDQYTYLNLSSYTLSPSKDYAINTVPEIKDDTKTIGLIVKDVAPGNYSIGFEGLSKLQLGYTITLVDQFLNKETLVTEGTSYAFAVTNDHASYGDARFKVRFDTRVTGLSENDPILSQMAYPNPTTGKVTLALPKDLDTAATSVKLYDTQGNLLLTSDKDSSLLKQGEKFIDLSTFKSGVYILNITSGLQVKSIRLIKK